MELFALLKFLIRLPKLISIAVDFAQGTSDLATTSDIRLDGLTSEEIDWLRSCVRSLIRTCLICVIVFGVALPLGMPWYTRMSKNITVQDAQTRMICGTIFMTFLIPISLFLGASVGCLFAPSKFLLSPLGEKWLNFIGTRSIAGARVVSFLAAAALTMFFVGYCWFIYSMRPTDS